MQESCRALRSSRRPYCPKSIRPFGFVPHTQATTVLFAVSQFEAEPLLSAFKPAMFKSRCRGWMLSPFAVFFVSSQQNQMRKLVNALKNVTALLIRLPIDSYATNSSSPLGIRLARRTVGLLRL